jgi:hypothetical protein
MRRIGFEPTTPEFERAKTVHALDRKVTVTTDASGGAASLALRTVRHSSAVVDPSVARGLTEEEGETEVNKMR